MNQILFGRRSLSFLLLAAVFAAALLAHVRSAEAATVAVTNCNDDGAGSLRDVLFITSAGDVVDLRKLPCNRIVLTSGPLLVGATRTLLGPSNRTVTLDGNKQSTVIRQASEFDKLTISHLTIANGVLGVFDYRTGGGCIRTHGTLELRYVRVHHCVSVVDGGGIYSEKGDVLLFHSSVDSNSADGANMYSGAGGGIYGYGALVMDHSRIVGNTATFDGGGAKVARGLTTEYSTISGNTSGGIGGGAYVRGNVTILNSTFSGNRAGTLGALYETRLYDTPQNLIVNSTFSGNAAGPDGSLALAGDTAIANSTIAFNQDLRDTPDLPCGTAVRTLKTLHLESSIVAMNHCDRGREIDVDAAHVIGANNIIGYSTHFLPRDTLHVDPQLAPLAYYGGPTKTHALQCDSPAINRGNNSAGLSYDQRGTGYPRVQGTRADIGAFERRGP